MLPPPLEWVEGFTRSIRRATDNPVTYEVSSTVNPLVFRVRLSFPQPLSGKSLMLVWNLFQMYAAKNESVPQGKKIQGERALVSDVVIKRRLGPPRVSHPAER